MPQEKHMLRIDTVTFHGWRKVYFTESMGFESPHL